VLHALLSGLSDAWLDADEGPNTWSPREVVAHLADLEDQDWMVRARIILDQGESRPFPPVNRERFRPTLAGKTAAQLLDLFAQRRALNLRSLDQLALKPADLNRKGTHPALGPVTLEQLLATWVVHDFTHLGQIVRVMARRYGQAVGPWSDYLGILSWRKGENI
jgi:uncharacterized damage-inducible protein DinB